MLPQSLKAAATAAFRDNTKLSLLTPEEREQAAQWYLQVAQQTRGTKADLAGLYNQERARFLRGEVSRLAATAGEFADEIGWSPDATV